MHTDTTTDAQNSYIDIDFNKPLATICADDMGQEAQEELDRLWASLRTHQQSSNVQRDWLGQSCAVAPIVDVGAAMKVALERTASRVFHETLVHHYGAEFADVVSEQVFGGKRG